MCCSHDDKRDSKRMFYREAMAFPVVFAIGMQADRAADRLEFLTRASSRRCNLGVADLAERVAEPFESLVKTVSAGCASRLNVLYRVISKSPMR